MRKAIFWAAGMALSSTALGQQVIKVDTAYSQAQVRRDDQGFSACGVRVVAIAADGDKTRVYDFSVMFYGDSVRGGSKFGMSVLPTAAVLNRTASFKALLPAPTSFWIARVDQAKAARPIKYLPGEDAGFTLGLMDAEPAIQAIADIAMGAPMQFNVRYKNDRFDVVNQFTAPLSDDDLPSYQACFRGIEDRLRSK